MRVSKFLLVILMVSAVAFNGCPKKTNSKINETENRKTNSSIDDQSYESPN